MVDGQVVASVRLFLAAVTKAGIPVRFGVVFGSQTTGEAGPLSDIDLLVVSPRFDARRSRDDLNLLWRLAARVNSRIEPVPCGEKQWRDDDSSALIEIARRKGETVHLAA